MKQSGKIATDVDKNNVFTNAETLEVCELKRLKCGHYVMRDLSVNSETTFVSAWKRINKFSFVEIKDNSMELVELAIKLEKLSAENYFLDSFEFSGGNSLSITVDCIKRAYTQKLVESYRERFLREFKLVHRPKSAYDFVQERLKFYQEKSTINVGLLI